MSARIISLAAIIGLTMMISGHSLQAQWQQVTGVPTNYVNTINVDEASGLWFAGGYGYGVVRSSNRGATWTPAAGGLTQWALYVYDLFFFQGCLFAGTRDGVYRSTSFGDSWERVSAGIVPPLSDQIITCYRFGVLNNTLYAGTRGGAYSTTDLGLNWTPVITNGNNVRQIDAFLQINDTLLAGGGDRFLSGLGLFRSTDGGIAWTLSQVHTFSVGIFCFANTPAGLYAGTSHGAFISTNSGVTWTRVSNGLGPDPYLMSMTWRGDSVIAGTLNGVYISTDQGNLWTLISSDLPISARAVQSMLIIDDTLYIGTETGGMWRKPIAQATTGVSETAPHTFTLHQNYPNPFNPATTIAYDVASHGRVTIAVYNVLGQEVATLVDEVKSPGKYTAVWSAAGQASGMYLCRLTANGSSRIQRMVLVR
jgi:photosystem II stability/assembly factor-like uncharacterized protein